MPRLDDFVLPSKRFGLTGRRDSRVPPFLGVHVDHYCLIGSDASARARCCLQIHIWRLRCEIKPPVPPKSVSQDAVALKGTASAAEVRSSFRSALLQPTSHGPGYPRTGSILLSNSTSSTSKNCTFKTALNRAKTRLNAQKTTTKSRPNHPRSDSRTLKRPSATLCALLLRDPPHSILVVPSGCRSRPRHNCCQGVRVRQESVSHSKQTA